MLCAVMTFLKVPQLLALQNACRFQVTVAKMVLVVWLHIDEGMIVLVRANQVEPDTNWLCLLVRSMMQSRSECHTA